MSSVSGGNCTWKQLVGVSDNPDVELWLGTVTSTGSLTIVVSFGNNFPTGSVSLAAQEFTSGQGSSSAWILDQSGSVNSTTSSTAVSYPSLTASGTGELYVGDVVTSKSPSSGSSSGFTYVPIGAKGEYAYNANVSGTQTPTASQSPAGTYVAVGVILRAASKSVSSSTNYSWTAASQLCVLNVGSAARCTYSNTGTRTPWGQTLPSNGTAYEYGADGPRIGADSAVGSTWTLTDSTWDSVSGGSIPLNINDAVTTSVNPSTPTNTSYIYGSLLFGGTAPIEQISGTTASFLVANPTGVQVVVSSSGSLLERALYSPYGVPTIQAGSIVTPFGFQGSYTDATGLIYLINRYYDPTTDQFLSVDPMVDSTGQPYVFANDNPLNGTDPLGLKGWYCIDGRSHYYQGDKYGKTGSGKCKSSSSSTDQKSNQAGSSTTKQQAVTYYIAATNLSQLETAGSKSGSSIPGKIDGACAATLGFAATGLVVGGGETWKAGANALRGGEEVLAGGGEVSPGTAVAGLFLVGFGGLQMYGAVVAGMNAMGSGSICRG